MSDEIGPVTIYSQWENVSILDSFLPTSRTNLRRALEPSAASSVGDTDRPFLMSDGQGFIGNCSSRVHYDLSNAPFR